MPVQHLAGIRSPLVTLSLRQKQKKVNETTLLCLSKLFDTWLIVSLQIAWEAGNRELCLLCCCCNDGVDDNQ